MLVPLEIGSFSQPKLVISDISFLKSLKKEIVEDGVKKDNDILDDDLTIIAIGK